MSKRIWQVLLGLGVGMAGVLSTGRASATLYQVTTSSACTLPLAIQAVNTRTQQGACPAGNGLTELEPGSGVLGDRIVLSKATYTLTGAQNINRTLIIEGQGVGDTTVRSNLSSGTDFIIVNPGTVETQVILKSLTVDKSSSQASPHVCGVYVYSSSTGLARLSVKSARIAGHTWSGLYSYNATIVVEDSTIENNSSLEGGGGIHVHASIENAGGLTTDRTTINNNTTSGYGGGIYFAGNGSSQIRNTTISGNIAQKGGGVAYESPNPFGAYFNLILTTVTQNSASAGGGGVYTPALSGYDANFGTVGTIIANNSSNFSPDFDGHLHATTTSLISDTVGMDFPEPGHEQGNNLYDLDPLLDPVLRSWTKTMKMHRLMPGSVALDMLTAEEANEDTDQRGIKRPQLGSVDASLADLGAYEESRLETEIMGMVSKSSGVTHTTVSGTTYSNGIVTNLQSTQNGHFVTYSTPALLLSGAYTLVAGYKKGSNGGDFQVAYSSSPTSGFTNIGGVQPGYAASNTPVSVLLGNISSWSTGTMYIRFTVTSSVSGRRQLFPDFVELTKQ